MVTKARTRTTIAIASLAGSVLSIVAAAFGCSDEPEGLAHAAAPVEVAPPPVLGEPAAGEPATGEQAEATPESAEPEPAEEDDTDGEPDYRDPMTKQGQTARGLYYTAQFLKRHGAEGVVRSVSRAQLDAAVIDVKDAAGRIGHQTGIEILEPQVEGYLGDARQFVAHLRENGIYTIARVACFADPQLPVRHPEHAIQDRRPRKRGQAWTSWGTGHAWLDPYDPHNHQLVIDLAKEVEALGFDEIQLDYIRFPVDDGTELAVYPHQTDQPRDELLLGLLGRIDAAISIPISVDVFGLTAFRDGDPPELGQHLEEWRVHVEVYSPMLYLNSMRNWMRGDRDRVFVLVHNGIENMRRRLGDEPVIRPFLQGFRRGADYWNPHFITRQIQASKQGGADGFLFWSTSSNYEMVRHAMTGPARRLSPFGIATRERIRAERWGEAVARAE